MTREAGREKETSMTATARVNPSYVLTELQKWQKCSAVLGFTFIAVFHSALNIHGCKFITNTILDANHIKWCFVVSYSYTPINVYS